MIRFDELVPGDRFRAYGNLYTKLTEDTARDHTPASYGVPGYVMNGIYAFHGHELVEFVPITEVAA